MKRQLLFLFALLTSGFVSGQTCEQPTALTITNLASTWAVIGWQDPNATNSWEILVQPPSAPAPTMTSTGIMATSAPYTFSGLNCGTLYDVYIRAVCSETSASEWTGPFAFQTIACTGQPIDMMECVNDTTGLACFDLNVNTAATLGDLNPADYTVTYHLTQADASVNMNPISTATDYCFSTGTSTWATQDIWARLSENANGSFWTFPFTLSAQTQITNMTPLPSMVQCDNDNDVFVIFDLTTTAAQISSTNALAYYINIEDATNMVNPVANPTAFTMSTLNPVMTVFVRETVIGDCDNIYMLPVNAMANCNVANVCAGANSLCNSLGIPFSNTVNVTNAEPGNNYGCLGSQPNPTWFYLPVSDSGNITLMIQQSTNIAVPFGDLDVDFICYGPFTNPTAPCSGQLTGASIVSCSYSTSATEFVGIPNAIAGQYYLIMVTNFSNMPGYIKITEDGSSQGTIACTGIRMNAFLDSNSNGIKDGVEPNFPLGQFNYELNADGIIHNVISPTGIYNIYDINPANVYDLGYTIDPTYTGNYALTSSSYPNVSIVPGTGMQEYDFPVTVTQNYNDLAVAIVPNGVPRPGFAYANTVMYTNMGNQPVAGGTVSFTKDPAVTITSVSEPAAVTNPTGFTFDFTDLLPFETRQVTVTMLVPNLPIVALGDLLTNTADIVPLTGDIFPENNSAISAQVIIGSFDPNDKMEARGPQIMVTDFDNDDFLYYTIRFENTGSASAINVRITDLLDGQLDGSSLRMVSASHDYTLDRVGNQLTWNFDNIFLPGIASGSPLPSNGYVHFKIKPNPGYAAGDIIPNTASIFFDYNPAIVTNTFNTEFVALLGTNQYDADGFMCYPNPATSSITISMGSNAGQISGIAIYDMLGKTILSKKSSDGVTSETLDVSGISSGIYFLEVTSGNNRKTVKKIMVN